MTAVELRQLRAGVVAKMRGLNDSKRNFDEAEQRQYDAWTQEADALTTRIRRAENLERSESSLEGAAPVFDANGQPIDPRRLLAPIGAGGSSMPDLRDRGGSPQTRSWEALCRRSNVAVDMGQWRDGNEFFSTVIKRIADPRLQTRAMGETTLDQGGFLVPPQLAAQIMNLALEDEICRSRATVIPITSASAYYPLFDSYDRSGGSVNGITASWPAEHSAPTEQQPRVELVGLQAKKFMILVRLSSEILEDVPGLTAQLTTALGRAVGFHLDSAFLSGVGSSTPEGVLSSPALIVQAKEVGQSDSTVVPENLTGMMARLAPGSWKNSIWICHPSVLPELFHMPIEIGTGGSVVSPMTRDAAGNLSLYGRPLLPSEKVPPLGSEGDIGIFDLSRYLIALRSELRISIDQSAAFSSDEVLLKLRMRVDGRGMDAKAQTPANGTDSLGPFVALAERDS